MAENEKPEKSEEEKAAAEAKKKERAEKAKAKGGGGKKAAEPTGPAPKYKREKPPRLKKHYDEAVRAAMMKEFSYKTPMQVPRVVKVTVNMGLGKAKDEPKMIDNGV